MDKKITIKINSETGQRIEIEGDQFRYYPKNEGKDKPSLTGNLSELGQILDNYMSMLCYETEEKYLDPDYIPESEEDAREYHRIRAMRYE